MRGLPESRQGRDAEFSPMTDRDELARDKGQRGGSCNRTACQMPNSAWWFNTSTQAYYCERCARKINLAAGTKLCVPGWTAREAREETNGT